MNARLCSVMAALLVAACGGDDPLEVGTQPLAGRIGGQPWTFGSGGTDAFLSQDDELFTKLYGEAHDPVCSAFSTSNRIVLGIPKQPGDYAFSLQRNGTFVVGGTDNLIATEGRLIVESVDLDAGTVTARVHMTFDADNEVDGRFTAAICP